MGPPHARPRVGRDDSGRDVAICTVDRWQVGRADRRTIAAMDADLFYLLTFGSRLHRLHADVRAVLVELFHFGGTTVDQCCNDSCRILHARRVFQPVWSRNYSRAVLAVRLAGSES